ncbi:disease resistance protein rpm1-like [Trifolium pratense]|uniref:Disease resistance protein rpm1-like n=1 Tax=Trifolium pratense TaxID=57577 RepID=A0A2K3L8Q2_TRIPR|nr:disease resistance protein rpm1-like [Trifolium pratense]
MAEIAVSLVIDQLIPLLWEEAKLFKGIHKEFADIKDELESIQAFLKDADKRAAAEGENTNEGVKTVRTFVGRLLQILELEEDDEHIAQIPKRVYHSKL